jgi:hypothetical protein
MILNVARRSAYILTWTVFIPSILGFQLTGNSQCERHGAFVTSSVVTSRRSPILPTKPLSRGIQLESIWGSSSSSSSSSSNNEDEDTNDEETTKETETTPTKDAAVDTSTSSTVESTSSAVSTEKSLLALLNDIGNNFKGMAQKATTKGYTCEDQKQKILFAAKACLYYTLFIIYRSYRGFFVLLPATFKQVYQKMEATMITGNLSLEETGEDITSTSTTWRTKVTVGILTSVITISYIVGGVVKMATKFIRTIAKTSDVPKSFGAAADEVMNIEGRISRVGKVNGDEGVGTSGLAP